MATLNKVMLIGRLGKDPEVRYTSGGTAVASFSLATTERVKSNGEWQEKTEWHTITLWARLAEIAGEYLGKGKEVYIEGRLQTRKWQDKDGKDRYTTEIVGERMQMLSGKGEGGSKSEVNNKSSSNKQGQSNNGNDYTNGFEPDEVPF